MTDATTLFLTGLFLLIASAVIVGELFTRIGQAALVGQLIVGVVLGPSLLGPYVGLTSLTTELSGLQIVATFFILMMAGLAVSPSQLRSTGASAAVFGLTIFFVPFLLGTFVVRLLYPGFSDLTDLFIALAVSITALPVLGVMLREFDLVRSRFGTFLLNVSVVNELTAVTVFAVLLRIYNGGSSSTFAAIATSIGVVVLFLGTVLSVHWGLRALRRIKVWDRLVERFRATWRSRDIGFAILIVVALGAALYSQLLGLTYIIGAFYAGLLVTPESAGRREHREVSMVLDAITWGFFIPLFFALVGFGTDFRSITGSVVTLAPFIGLTIYAIFSKLFAGAGVARVLGWSPQESLAAGFLVTSRGAVELAMAVIMLSLGVINEEIYTVIAGVGLICTIISPIGARPFVRQVTEARRANEEEARRLTLELSMPPAKYGTEPPQH
jgi:Kef-type K+ transport system membrane component KefB